MPDWTTLPKHAVAGSNPERSLSGGCASSSTIKATALATARRWRRRSRMLKRFEPGNTLGPGRPRGARNKLASNVLRDVLEFWNEPVKEGATLTKGRAALMTAWREKPTEFVKTICNILPKEFVFENVANELDDNELNRMIEAF